MDSSGTYSGEERKTSRWSAVGAPIAAARRRRTSQSERSGPTEYPERPGGKTLANALGLFSIGLGLAEIAMPGRMVKLIGYRGNGASRKVMRAMGARELLTGMGVMAESWPVWSMRGRVLGDGLDLYLLGRALRARRSRRSRTAMALLAVATVALLDVRSARRLGASQAQRVRRREIEVKRSITVNRSPEEVYRFWHDLENLPRFMRHLESVEVLGDGRSRWRARAPAGRSVEWEAVTTEDRPGELIAWESVQGDVENAGRVRFQPAPGGRGTEIHAELSYRPPGGRLAATLTKLFGEEPGQQVDADLRHFKQVIETGEVLLSDSTVRRLPSPAQPSGKHPEAT